VQLLLAGNLAVPVKNVKELIALAKARPGELTYGSTSLGGGPHLAGELVQSMSGIRWVHVPFKGAGPASVALMSGDINFLFSSTGSLVGHVRAGKVRGIAVTGPRRFPELPEVPTVAESGIPGYSATGWYGLFAPAGTSPELVHRISAEAARAFSSPDAKEKLAQIGTDPVGSTPEEFVSFLRAEIAKWSKVVTEANIRFE
jgi:tripartite-type tricarboxylate transporter receptor subunit TctC